MKTALIFSAYLAGLLPAAQTLAATAVASGWQPELKVVQQASGQDSAARTRADAILAAVVDATRNGLTIEAKTIQTTESAPTGANLDTAVAQAAYSAMAALYPSSGPTLDAWLAQSLAEINDSASAIAAGRKWGEHVAQVIVAEPSDAELPNSTTFTAAPASPKPAQEMQGVLSAEKGAIGPDSQTVASAELAPIGPGRYQFSVLAGSVAVMDLPNNYVDGTGAAAQFANPGGIAVDAAGNVYVSEQTMATIRKITPDGTVTTIAGAPGKKGSVDGAGAAARFSRPMGLAVDNAGNVLVADYGNSTIRKIDPSGNVTTLAGSAGDEGEADGIRGSAQFYHPGNIAVDAAGNLFVTQEAWYGSKLATSHPLLRQIAPDGTVSSITVPFPPGKSYYAPDQIGVDRAGNVYVIAMLGNEGSLWDDAGVLRLTPTGEPGKYTASELVPPAGYSGGLLGISLDQNDTLLIRNGGDPFHLYSPTSGWQTAYPSGIADLSSIKQVVISRSGILYTIPNGDPYLSGVVEVGFFNPAAAGPVLLSEPWDEPIRVGDTGGFSVVAVGGPGLTYQWYFDSTPINGGTTNYLTIPNAKVADSGRHYSVVVSDGAGSVASNVAALWVAPSLASSTVSSGSGTSSSGSSSSGTGTSPSAPGTGPALSGSTPASSGGGGSLDPRSSLLAFLLLAARKLRRRVSQDGSATEQ